MIRETTVGFGATRQQQLAKYISLHLMIMISRTLCYQFTDCTVHERKHSEGAKHHSFFISAKNTLYILCPSFHAECMAVPLRDGSNLLSRMHTLRQCLLETLGNGLLRGLRYHTVAGGVALASVVGCTGGGAGVVDGVGNFLFDFLGEDFLQLLWDNGTAGGV